MTVTEEKLKFCNQCVSWSRHTIQFHKDRTIYICGQCYGGFEDHFTLLPPQRVEQVFGHYREEMETTEHDEVQGTESE